MFQGIPSPKNLISVSPSPVCAGDVSPAFKGSQNSHSESNLLLRPCDNIPGPQDPVSPAPAPRDVPEGTKLHNLYFVLNNGMVFNDKKLPSDFTFKENEHYSINYFLDLHNRVSSLKNFTFCGAREKLAHCQINVKKFRELLPSSFEDISILQYMEFCFSLG